jgi:hypothetical protein
VKFRKFIRALAQSDGFIVQRAFGFLQQLGIKDAHHGGARAGGADDGFSVAEDAQKALRDGTRFIPEAGVEGGLAAAGLAGGKVNFAAKPPQDFHRVHGHLGL